LSYAQNYIAIKNSIPTNVTLIAVSKTHPIEAIEEVYSIGCRHFGENKVQDLVQKYAALPKDINWHMIGHLQTNKVKMIVPFVHLIHSIDSFKLLGEINKEAAKAQKKQNCLLQFYIAQEETKFGFTKEETIEMLHSPQFESLQNIIIKGVMGMASFTDDETIVKNEFLNLKSIFNDLKQSFFINNTNFDTISMGMSGDYELAIEQGSTMVRVGTSIFGTRNYSNK
jgi:pyridoxal phosphate enzyme (YggS family)